MKTSAIARTLLPLFLIGASPSNPWRIPDPARLLVIDTSRGRVVIEMEPRVAPKAVERVSLLARRGTYDGLLFHRVIDGFVAQTGNPGNKDGGRTELPDVAAEFWFRPAVGDVTWVRSTGDVREGVLGSLPVVKGSIAEHWVASCAGMFGMGRERDLDTANAEIFINRAATRELDHDYTLFGRVLSGQAAVDALAVGHPPPRPDRMVRVRLASDMPPGERPRVAVMDARAPAFAAIVAARKRHKGAALSICDLLPPVRDL